ncbi:MAG: iron-only hydrogenase system regulator [Syntrophomonadaceae bacterium]|nr:iron-only hydrogenase system regulator [Syntrophomonadaceae bacterium]
MDDNRLGVIGIVIENREEVPRVNEILSNHAEMIIGRMGLPYREKNVAVISLIVDGTTDQLGSLTGKLGNIPGITVKSALSKKSF